MLMDSMGTVLVHNTSDRVKSFTVKVTYKSGDEIVATGSGAVSDLLPGQRRAAGLFFTQAPPPSAELARFDVDAMIHDAPTTPRATAASKIEFGKPVATSPGLPMIDVEATNNDSVPHSFTLQVTYLKGGELVGLASGAVQDLAPGQTKTATLFSASGEIPAHDEALVSVDALVE